MIEFKHPKELEILKHYADTLQNESAQKFVKNLVLSSNQEAADLAKFYWQIVDQTTEEDSNGVGQFQDMDMWLERIYTSIHIYVNNIGYGDSWEKEIP